jgi:predicted MPP superfamily phosphohydrolase
MSGSTSILAISIWIGVVQLLIDVYVVARWTSTVRRMEWSAWWYRTMWVLLVLMTCLYWYVAVRRNFYRLDGADVVLFAIVTLWSLPKIAIVPILLIRDGMMLLRKLGRLLRRLRSTSFDGENKAVELNPGRRQLLTSTAWGLTVLPYGMVANGMFSTLYDFRVHNVEIEMPNLPRALDGIRIVQISDIHAGSFYDYIPFQEARRIIDSLKPDVLAITGDFVNAKPSELGVIWRELEKLKAREAVVGVLGNHDHYHSDADHAILMADIRKSGIDLLVNEQRSIRIGSERLVIAGTDNTGFRQSFARLDRALAGVSPDEAVVLLAHDPTYFDRGVQGSPVNLMLSGHTHGGQVGVQMLGFEWSPAQYVYKHWAGLYQEGNQHIYVNRGLGTVGPPMRIGIQPEITHITLRCPSASATKV